MASGSDFKKFRRFLIQRLAPDDKTAQRILDEAKDINSLFPTIDLTKEDIYRLMAEYLELEYVSMVDLAQVNLEAFV
jgi:hypothetical protein